MELGTSKVLLLWLTRSLRIEIAAISSSLGVGLSTPFAEPRHPRSMRSHSARFCGDYHSAILMMMTASETKSTPAVFAVVNPANVLRQLVRDHLAHRRIPRVMTITALHRRCWRHRAENRRHALFREAHVEIPLISDRERLDAVGDRMLRQLRKFRVPMRVDRVLDLKTRRRSTKSDLGWIHPATSRPRNGCYRCRRPSSQAR